MHLKTQLKLKGLGARVRLKAIATWHYRTDDRVTPAGSSVSHSNTRYGVVVAGGCCKLHLVS